MAQRVFWLVFWLALTLLNAASGRAWSACGCAVCVGVYLAILYREIEMWAGD